ncbi:MAG: hypothetical protein HGB05_11035, partial [Chloroflexi bacterium]|nr:hypothetical protein [Chloroflexota bacterium]
MSAIVKRASQPFVRDREQEVVRDPAGDEDVRRGIAAGRERAEVETSEETQIRDLRKQEITQLRIALGRRVENNRRADLYFRLAEIYLEAYR